MGDVVRHRAHQYALGTPHALVPHDHQAGVLFLRDVEDRVGRGSLTRVAGYLDARLSRDLGRLGKASLDILLRVERPMDVLRRQATTTNVSLGTALNRFGNTW